MEDHEILVNHLFFKQADFGDYVVKVWNESGNRLSRGLNLYLGVFSAMFGPRWWLWHTLVLSILTLALTQFRLLGIKLGLSRNLSFILPFMLVVGTPTELMTRLATIESMSLLISGILLNRIAAGILGWKTLGLVLLLFFTKESFVLLSPFVVLFSYFCSAELKRTDKTDIKKSHYFALGVMGICFLFAGAFFYTDTTNTEADYVLSQPTKLLSNVISYLTHAYYQPWLSSTPIPYLVILASVYLLVRFKKQGGQWFWSLTAIGLISIAIQLVLLSSVGYSGRYLIPSLMVLYVLFATGMARMRGLELRKGIIAGALVLVFSFQVVWSKKMIDEYIDSGNAIQQLVNYVSETCQESCRVLLVGDPLINIEMFEALMAYISARTENVEIEVKILPTEPDIERFSELAEIYDGNSINRFKKGFQDHYQERLVTNCQGYFNLIVFIGEQTRFESVCPLVSTEKPTLSVGKSWYQFQTINADKSYN